MKKSKHFRKDVIVARIIAAIILVILIAMLVFVISLFTKPSADSNKDSQNTEHTQNVKPGIQESESEEIESEGTEEMGTEEQSTEEGSEESDVSTGDTIYVKTTAQINLREEPNTNCDVIVVIPKETELEVVENLKGWYKVSYNGQIGYVSADYVRIVEE